MTRVLRSATKKIQDNEIINNKLNISKKSKTIKRGSKKVVVEGKDESIKHNDIWDITSILSSIFSYTEFKDLVNANSVCKKWNHITNPTIHRTFKLQRSRAIQNKVHDKRFHKAAKTDAEVAECIANNSKFAPLVKEFKLDENLNPQRSTELFETFRFITIFTIERVGMSQDQFLAIMKSLNQIKELNLKSLSIKKIFKKRFYTKSVQLPPTLTKLTLENVYLSRNPEQFIQTINSHTNLIEFSHITYNQTGFLDPFYKNYPSLKSFKYSSQTLDNPQSLYDVVQFNPQLIALNLQLKCTDSTLISHINSYLVNLEDFNLYDSVVYNQTRSDITAKFSHPTKIKKLKVTWDKLSQCSVNSILSNCPHLEDLSLIQSRSYLSTDSIISLNIVNYSKILKLAVSVDSLNKSSFDFILLNCVNLRELHIQLPTAWKEWIDIVGTRCMGLDQLALSPTPRMNNPERESFFQELYETEFKTNTFTFMNTITKIILRSFNFNISKAEYFTNFTKLRSIKFPLQYVRNLRMSKNQILLDKDLWPNFRLRDHKVLQRHYDIELIKSTF
ncbi:hypothetical protein CONCODRAFT_7033 [Conidiobolus coronatus NRRL 28638]|uniref:F-box domain-containing protein n=1 Tax=Conidiobolus coronatus (strain ATCC 28846 / CBS 209.66 / NRRL 28638) TaxID=796925 RepID=A0A137P5X0_CONC2|nr:hypothetical protein CONCODRAFT_7033 [Conidiobolus coronatus NRRL 28638]|eukprot:KXN70408.1 hypothetical protein CONCODRAFT_7033 [Conidiobolus coronatus NRRL 28638]